MARSLSTLARPFADLPTPVWALFASNVVNYAGNFVWPLLTLLLTERLGMSPERASLFVSLAVVSYVPGTALGGRLADRLGRKRVTVVSRVAAALLMLPCAALEPSTALIWLIVASRAVASTADPALGAMATDLASGPRRAGAVALLYLGLNLGFAVGPLLAGMLFPEHLPWVFAGDALTTLLSAALIAAWVPETLPSLTGAAPPTEAERPVEGSLWVAVRQRPPLFPLAATLLLLATAYSQVFFALPLQAVLLLGEDGPKAFGAAMAVNGLTVVAASLLVVRIPWRPEYLVAAGGLLYALGFGAVRLAEGAWGLALTTVIWSVGEVLVATNWRLFVANLSPDSHRARIMGAMEIVFGAGFVAGPVLAGAIIAAHGVPAVWPACLLVAAVGSLGFAASLVLARRREQMTAPPLS